MSLPCVFDTGYPSTDELEFIGTLTTTRIVYV